ncbi:MAG: glutamate decarboxylase [Methanobacteriaceae archaeon]|nr:glutamate decarboxylase [Methanobacteriaceae archaeon]
MLSNKKTNKKFEKEINNIKNELENPFGNRQFRKNIPKYELPEESLPSDYVYELIHNELSLDGNPLLNLASFVTTWMEPEANKLINENMGKNFIDVDEYPQTFRLQERCINILANLFNSSEKEETTGTATIGSSEAIMLGLLAHKWTWQKRRESENKSTDKPNIVMGGDVHTVWKKFALYFDVELKLIPLTENKYTITPEEVKQEVDENTICVGAVVGTTFTGESDSVEKINDVLLEIKEEKGWNIPIHVDAASGGFILPFSEPEIKWDFRLEQVRSINVSGHKYGLVYPGIGWLLFKNKDDIPEELIFNINYLGNEMSNYSLNFSKGSSMIIAQYYNFLRLGKKGYTDIVNNMLSNSKYLIERIEQSNKFNIINKNAVLPVIVLSLKNEDKNLNVYRISESLRSKGWIVPAYSLPPNAENVKVLRIVLKETMGRNMIDYFLKDLFEVYDKLINSLKYEKKEHSLLY